MAASSLLALIDDIAMLLDDVATMTKVAARQSAASADDVAAMTQLAAKKTAGVLGDDLALNAQQVTGVKADRELPVVWAVAKGSLLNKVILVPAALVISAIAPWMITPLLMLGGLFLCFEGAEKLLHTYLQSSETKKHIMPSWHKPWPMKKLTCWNLNKTKSKVLFALTLFCQRRSL
jgi:predicted DNA repair protein MutK